MRFDISRMVPVACLVALLLSFSSPAAAASASETVQQRHAAVLELVERGADDAALARSLDELIDYRWLAEASLGGPEHYASVCAEHCAEFEALLTKLVRVNYLRLVRSAKHHPLEVVGEVEGKGGLIKVSTELTIQKSGEKSGDQRGRTQQLRVDYVLHRVDGRWQVRDLITDGVSLVKTYRHEFHTLARKEGMTGILARLRARLDS